MDTSEERQQGLYTLRISEGSSISYDRETLDKVFSTNLEPQVFFKEAKAKFKKLGIPWEDKLLLGFDSNGCPMYSDKVNTYVYNSEGYRSKEFDGSAKLLYAGCSTTFGTGVPEEAIWGSMVASKLGVPWANISKQGTSASWIVKSIFAYFDKYGHPDTVCCLFPDLFRTTIATNTAQLRYTGNGAADDHKSANGFTKIYDIHLENVLPPSLALDYSKKPHDMLDVIPADTAVYSSIQSILLLDQYCRVNGIKFIWSTWDVNIVSFISELKSLYPKNYSGFVDSDLDWWIDNPDQNVAGEVYIGSSGESVQGKDLPPIDCHQELLDKYGVNFYRGLDDFHGVRYAHPGIHQHAHVADAFLDALL